VEPNSPERIEQIVKEAKDLLSKLEGTSVRRLSVAVGDFKVEIERAVAEGAAVVAAAAPVAGAPAAAGAAARDTRHVMLAPLVGTFYRAPNAGAKPFVEVGERVQRGQPIGIIEAMKLMNEVAADATGVVVDILVENAQSVQFDQPLLVIDTAA
jgi:acetyl-CoA carboxylase biotin carboxyl carrier protein